MITSTLPFNTFLFSFTKINLERKILKEQTCTFETDNKHSFLFLNSGQSIEDISAATSLQSSLKVDRNDPLIRLQQPQIDFISRVVTHWHATVCQTRVQAMIVWMSEVDNVPHCFFITLLHSCM